MLQSQQWGLEMENQEFKANLVYLRSTLKKPIPFHPKEFYRPCGTCSSPNIGGECGFKTCLGDERMDGVGKLDRNALSGYQSQGRLCLMAFSALLRTRS